MIANHKKTDNLLQELKHTAQIEDYLDANREALRHESFTEAIGRVFRAQGRSKSEVARAAGISDIYLYQIFSGQRRPSRDRLIRICLGMRMGEEDTQQLLRSCGYSPLYAREPRDAVLLHGILHGKTLQDINRLLLDQQLPPLT